MQKLALIWIMLLNDLVFLECARYKCMSKLLKKVWIRVLKKKIQNTQEIKRTLFNWTKQDKTCTFSRKSSFSSYIQHKKPTTINSAYLVSVRCLQAGRRKRAQNWLENLHVLSCLVQLKSILLISCAFWICSKKDWVPTCYFLDCYLPLHWNHSPFWLNDRKWH